MVINRNRNIELVEEPFYRFEIGAADVIDRTQAAVLLVPLQEHMYELLTEHCREVAGGLVVERVTAVGLGNLIIDHHLLGHRDTRGVLLC